MGAVWCSRQSGLGPFAFGIVLLVALLTGTARAQMMQNLSIGSAKALALANAVTATPTGIDAIHFNPAALVHSRERRLQLKGMVAHFEISARFGDYFPEAEQIGYIDYDQDPVPGTESHTNKPAVILPGVGIVEPPVLAAPMGGMSYRPPGSRMTFATAVYTTSGLGYVREDDDPGRYSGQVVAMNRLNYFAPSVGYEVTRTLSVGASVGFAWSGLGLKLPARAPHIAIATIEAISNSLCPDGTSPGLCQSLGDPVGVFDSMGTLEMELEDPLSLSVNLGLLWSPVPWFSLGMVYQSEGVADLKGDFVMDYQASWSDYWQRQPELLKSTGLLPRGNARESGEVSTRLIQPQHAAVGLSLQLFPSWRVNLDCKWTDTAAWDSMTFRFSRPVDLLKLAGLIQPDEAPDDQTMILPRGYESTLSWALGVEYRVNDALDLRFGVEQRPSGIPGDRQDLLMPLADTYLYGMGFAYRMAGNSLLELGAGYLKSEARIPANSSHNANDSGYRENGDFELGTLLYNPYAGIDFSTKVKAYLLAVSYQRDF